jgi:tetratricopeptide (TPR) repeat protein
MYKRFIVISLVMTSLLSYSSDAYIWKALNDKGVELYQQGRYLEAVTMAERAKEIAEKIFPANHPNIVTSLNNLAIVYYALGKTMLAESLYKQALGIDERTLGKDHSAVARDLRNLARVCHDMKKYTQARHFYLRALEINEKKLGKDHPRVINEREKLTSLYPQKPKLFRSRLDRIGKIEKEIPGKYRKTLLHEAAFGGAADVAELLIQKGAAVNARTMGGSTPLKVAACTSHCDLVKLLRKHGGTL